MASSRPDMAQSGEDNTGLEQFPTLEDWNTSTNSQSQQTRIPRRPVNNSGPGSLSRPVSYPQRIYDADRPMQSFRRSMRGNNGRQNDSQQSPMMTPAEERTIRGQDYFGNSRGSYPDGGSIRITRLPSSQNVRTTDGTNITHSGGAGDAVDATRRRRGSQPAQPDDDSQEAPGTGARLRTDSNPFGLTRPAAAGETLRGRIGRGPLSSVNEDLNAGQPVDSDESTVVASGPVSRRRSISNAARSAFNRFSGEYSAPPDYEYRSNVVDLLDVVDPEVSALTTLNNVQNSLFVPDLGRFVNRRPTYQLTRPPTRISERTTPGTEDAPHPDLSRTITRILTGAPTPGPKVEGEPLEQFLSVQRTPTTMERTPGAPLHEISSHLSEEHYAVLPHGESLEGWTEEDKAALDDHVRHMLHSKRSKFKQKMRGFGKYVRKPLGFLVTLYAVLITLFGLAWVLFLIGWISFGSRRDYIINVIDNVLVALFAIVGDGLAPFRAVDTYHMIFIARYHRLTKKIRAARAMPKLHDDNELPDKMPRAEDEDLKLRGLEASVLTTKQQERLVYHQTKFAKSHSFYKPHETTTHYAFPHRIFVLIVCLLDMHSCLQIALGACTWGISYKTRPFALTTVILACSITVNISAGIFIMIGDRKTRKKEIIEQMKRQSLTHHAMKRVKKHREDKEREREHERQMQEQRRESMQS